MSNPSHKKLSSQFGDITGPSDAELSSIETGGYSDADVEALRDMYAATDPNYAAVRRARKTGSGGTLSDMTGHRNTGTGGEGLNFAGLSDTSSAVDQTRTESAVHGVDASVDMGSSGDAPGARYSVSGSGMSGWDVDAGKRASSFDVNTPRSSDEARARSQGIMFLQVAGPTCNHPVCQSYRAKGMELLGRAIGSSRAIGENTHEAHPERPPFPSVRKDTAVPPMRLRPESKGKEKLVGSYGTGGRQDFGDFEPDYKNPVMTPKYTLVHTNDPEYKQMMLEYTAGVRRGNAPIFHPDDYMEHHHESGEELAKLPWE